MGKLPPCPNSGDHPPHLETLGLQEEREPTV